MRKNKLWISNSRSGYQDQESGMLYNINLFLFIPNRGSQVLCITRSDSDLKVCFNSISIDTLYQPAPDHTVSYNSENLTSTISQDPYNIQFLYGPFGNRIKTILTENGDTIKIKYYSGNYEKEIKGSVTRQLHYIYSPYGLVGVMIKQGEEF